MTQQVIPMSIQVPDTASDWQGDTKVAKLFRAPTAAHGGGMTILEAFASNEGATGAGTSFSWALHNYGTAGTAIKSTGGTIAAAIGGTASPWAAGVAQEFTLSYPYIAPGEYVVLAKDEVNSSDPSRGCICLLVAMGE